LIHRYLRGSINWLARAWRKILQNVFNPRMTLPRNCDGSRLLLRQHRSKKKDSRKSWAVYGAVAFLLLLVVSALAGYWWSFRNARATPSIHAEISPPEKHPFAATGDFGGMPVLSPQGDKITFVAGTSSAQQMLWVRVLASDSAQPLDGTDGAAHPFWSPDGRYIGFFANKKLNTIPVSGGQISVVADAINSRGGTWGADNMIVFSADFRNNLLKVNAQGGPISPATVLDQSKHTTHRWPWFLPDGKHFLYLATNHLGGNRQDNGIYFASVDNPQGHMVVLYRFWRRILVWISALSLE
jgi:hypothetical protein